SSRYRLQPRLISACKGARDWSGPAMAPQINRSHAAFLKWLAPLGQAVAGLLQWTNRGDGWRWLARIVCRAKHRCFHAWAYSGPLAALAGLFIGFNGVSDRDHNQAVRKHCKEAFGGTISLELCLDQNLIPEDK